MPNVARSLNSIAGDIRKHHGKVEAAAGDMLEAARAAGEALVEAKEQVNHGDWATWLEREAPGLSDRTARRYMQIAKHSEPEASAQLEQAQTAIERVIETHAPTEATE